MYLKIEFKDGYTTLFGTKELIKKQLQKYTSSAHLNVYNALNENKVNSPIYKTSEFKISIM